MHICRSKSIEQQNIEAKNPRMSSPTVEQQALELQTLKQQTPEQFKHKYRLRNNNKSTWTTNSKTTKPMRTYVHIQRLKCQTLESDHWETNPWATTAFSEKQEAYLNL